MRLFIMIVDIIGIWFAISIICTVIGMHLDGKTFESFGEEARGVIHEVFSDQPYEVCKFAFQFTTILSVAILGPLFITDAIKHKKARKRIKELQELCDKALAEMKDKGLIK